MQIEELMKRIRLPEEAGKAVRKQSIPEREYEAWKDMFNRDLKEFMEKWSARPDRYVWALEFCLRLAAEVYEVYCEKGISDKIFDDTFYDITIWCQECMRKYGICGMEETGWIAQSLKMNLFRLGRLQFEPLHGKLNVHIPAGEPLSYESCMDSFRQAEEFFGKHQTYVCDSWLLSPHLKEILPETSNIIRFQNLFEITGTYYDYPQAEQRVFGEIREDKEYYPERTLLQKNMKRYILEGKNPGIGVGFIDDIYKYI